MTGTHVFCNGVGAESGGTCWAGRSWSGAICDGLTWCAGATPKCHPEGAA